MENKKMKFYTLDQMKDKHIGALGTEGREKFEYELRMEIIGDMIKKARLERNLTQEELGKLIGVQKAQISKLENNANSATIDTIVRVFKALKADINFSIKLENKTLQLS
jgi:HTH-type transcriptional regulator / antitoxin HipB